jgi:hypothetical protein
MAFGRKSPEPEAPDDPTAYLLDSEFSKLVLLNTYHIKYMAMLCYTFFHGKP